MSDKKPKIVDDIVSELREKYASYYYCEESTRRDGEYPEGFDVIDTRKLADSIEEAVKRERAAFDCECAGIAELAAKEEAARHKPGNAAAMREALMEIETVAGEAVKNGTMELPQYSKIVYIAESALSAPPRNCDMPLIVDGPADNNADKAWLVFKQHNPDAYFDVSGLLRCIDWLLAPAKPETKGEGK